MAVGDEKFTGVRSINDYLFISNIENNLKSFLDWGFLNIGGFVNINSTTNSYNDNPNKLAVVKDPNYVDGQVWQTRHSNWVWENVDFNGSSPILISGVSVDGNPASAYILDYVNSRVIFNEPISNASNVLMDYSFRWVQIHKSNSNLIWWKQFQSDIVNDTTQFNQNTGEYAIFNQNRIQLPSIIIETVPRGTSVPYQLGDKSLISSQDIILHIVANNPAHRNSIIDIIRLQEDKVIWLYDTTLLVKEGVLPYNFDGSLNSNRNTYDELLYNEENGYNFEIENEVGEIVKKHKLRWKKCHLKDFVISEVESRYFFEEAKIRITAEIIFDDI